MLSPGFGANVETTIGISAGFFVNGLLFANVRRSAFEPELWVNVGSAQVLVELDGSWLGDLGKVCLGFNESFGLELVRVGEAWPPLLVDSELGGVSAAARGFSCRGRLTFL